MTNYSTGHDAEQKAADYLRAHGYAVKVLNWKTRVCEIDIVAEKSDCLYFVEVKYRASKAHGSGLDYITAKKLNQMRFAANCWVEANDWTGDYELAAIELSGGAFTVTNFLPNIG